MGNGKWIKVDSPEEPVTAVARRTLRQRLRWLWHYLPLAAQRPEEDSEYVHQLRIATRRAEAAVETFGPNLPPRRARWLAKKLRKVRRAAGAARDLDVLRLHLDAELHRETSPAVALLEGRAVELRRSAQPAIVEIALKIRRKRFPRRMEKLLARIRPAGDSATPPAPTFRDAAQDQLQRVVAGFYAAAAADLSEPAQMHQFRIAAKKLRYSMEIFAGALGDNFRRAAYTCVEQLQQHLGEVNDRVTFRAQCQSWLDQSSDPEERELLRRLLERETAAWQVSLEAFHQFWTPQCSAELKVQLLGEFAEHSDSHGTDPVAVDDPLTQAAS